MPDLSPLIPTNQAEAEYADGVLIVEPAPVRALDLGRGKPAQQWRKPAWHGLPTRTAHCDDRTVGQHAPVAVAGDLRAIAIRRTVTLPSS